MACNVETVAILGGNSGLGPTTAQGAPAWRGGVLGAADKRGRWWWTWGRCASNAISPGLKDKLRESYSRRIGVRQIGGTEKVAAAALLLMKNRFVNGSTLAIDGGSALVRAVMVRFRAAPTTLLRVQ